MTKQEFVDKIAERANLGRRDAQNAVDAMLDQITETLKGGGEIAFTASTAAPPEVTTSSTTHTRSPSA